jgi:predicted nucleotidyltransferase
MAKLRFPDDLREFLKLLNSARVEYLLIGGYAVGYYGYPRATADLDIWVAISEQNSRKLVQLLKGFGFDMPNLVPEVFLRNDSIVRFGEPPLRIEILTTISGVEFTNCFARRARVQFDGLRVNVIDLEDLKRNKAASGRPKDLDDLQALKDRTKRSSI